MFLKTPSFTALIDGSTANVVVGVVFVVFVVIFVVVVEVSVVVVALVVVVDCSVASFVVAKVIFSIFFAFVVGFLVFFGRILPRIELAMSSWTKSCLVFDLEMVKIKEQEKMFSLTCGSKVCLSCIGIKGVPNCQRVLLS